MKLIIVFLISITILSPHVFAGGPWAVGKKHGYAQLGLTLNRYDRLIVPSSSNLYGKRLLRTVTDNTLQVYGEYGMTDKLTFVSSIPLKILATSKGALPNGDAFSTLLPSGSLVGLGNVMLKAKYLLYNKGIVVSGFLETDWATFQVKQSVGLRTGYNSWGLCPGISMGASGKKWYGFVEGGYAFRTGGYSNELRYGGEFGGRFIKKTWMALVINIRQSMMNGSVNEGNVAQTAMYVNNQSYNAFGLKIAYSYTEKIGLNLSAYGAFGGNNVAAAPTFGGGIFYKW